MRIYTVIVIFIDNNVNKFTIQNDQPLLSVLTLITFQLKFMTSLLPLRSKYTTTS